MTNKQKTEREARYLNMYGENIGFIFIALERLGVIPLIVIIMTSALHIFIDATLIGAMLILYTGYGTDYQVESFPGIYEAMFIAGAPVSLVATLVITCFVVFRALFGMFKDEYKDTIEHYNEELE